MVGKKSFDLYYTDQNFDLLDWESTWKYKKYNNIGLSHGEAVW